MGIQKKLTILCAQTEGIKIGCGIEYLDKVILLPQLEKIPNSPTFVAGLLNLAGKSILVIDLALRLGLSHRSRYHLTTSILLCHANGESAGLIIDHVIGLAEILPEMIQKKENIIVPGSPFLGLVTLHNTFYLLLDLPAILDLKHPFPHTTLENVL